MFVIFRQLETFFSLFKRSYLSRNTDLISLSEGETYQRRLSKETTIRSRINVPVQIFQQKNA